MPFTPPGLDTEETFTPPTLDSEEKFTPPALSEEDKEEAALPSFRPAPEVSTFQKVKQAIRERLTPLIGPSEEEINRDGVTVTGPDAPGGVPTLQRVYKPGGDAIARLGLIGGLSQPAKEIPRATYDANDPMYKALLKAGYNVAAGFGEFAESPLGLATAGLGGAATIPASAFKGATTAEEAIAAARQLKTVADLQRAVGAGYALDMASKVPEAARAAGALSAQPGLGPKVEAGLQLAAAVGLPTMLGMHARAGMSPAEQAGRLLQLGVEQGPTLPIGTTGQPKPVSEFGGVADRAGVVYSPTGEVSPISTAAGLDLTEANKGNEERTQHAIESRTEPGSVQSERENRNESGQATEAGGGNRVLGATPGSEAAAGTLESLRESSAGGATRASDVSASARPPEEPPEPPVQTSGPVDAEAPPAILVDLVRDASAKREAIPASWMEDLSRAGTWALPEGYQREGEQWVYREPEKAETDAQRMVRENQQAMEGLRQLKAAESPESRGPGGRSPIPERPTERPEAGTPGMPMGERPPDILDWIGERFGRGVALGSKADYGDYLSSAKGRAKELMSLGRGEPADQVIKAMHESGEYLRITTPDELANEMVRAGAARKAPAPKFTPPELSQEEGNDPWQATIDKLNGLKLDTNGQLHAFGLVPETWNTLIDLAKLGVKAGKGVADAVDWAMQKFKEKFPGTAGFDENGAREHLVSQLGERETGVKLRASQAVSPEAKDAVTEYLYQTRSNATDQETADGIVQNAGIDAAERALLNPPTTMPGAVRSKLLGSVTRALAQSERLARANGDMAGAQALAERQGKLWDAVLPKITDLAESLQALRDIIDVTPEGQVARVRNALERKAREAVDGRGDQVEIIRGALDEGRRNGLEEVRQDPAVNGAARAAVNGTVANSPATHRAVIMDLAEGWSESPFIVNQARELVRERAGQILGKNPLPMGKTASEALRTTMDDLGKRAASIAANYFQGLAAHKNGLAGLYQERLGLDAAHAKRLAERMDKEFARQVEIAKNKLPQRIANARVAREREGGQLDLNAPASVVDRVIRRQLNDLNLKLGDVLRQEAERQDGTGRHVAERVVEKSGLTGEKADTLRNVLKQRWDALVTDAQRRALEAKEQATGTKVRGPLKDAFTKLVELHRLGALTGDRFYDVVKKSLGLKELTDTDAKRLKGLVEEAQKQPEGFLRERAGADVLRETEKLSGDRHWWDVPMAIWYTNAVSGLTTWAKIPFENTNMYVANILAALTSRPGELLRPDRFLVDTGGAIKRGLGKGALQAESTLRTGTVTGVWNRPKTNVLEGKPLGPKWDRLNFWKYLARITSTAHEVTFKPAWEFKQTMLARDVGRREGLRGQALDRRVADLMGNTADAVAKAKAQATQELTDLGRLTGRQPGEGAAKFARRQLSDQLDLKRRTGEIIEQQREAAMPGSTEVARDYALRTAYLNEPYGIMGILADGVNAALRKVRLEAPVTGTVLKTQIPFVRVASNILNEAWNWGPGGLQRAALSHWTGKLYGRPIMDPRERAEMYAKGMLGTMAVGTLAALYGDKIHGMGPSDPQRRKQLQAQGWIPHSIGPIDGRYYSLDKTPLKLWGAVLGNYEDWRRYGKGEDADGATRLAFVTKATASTLLNQSMLESLKNALEALGDTSTGGGAHKMEQALARAASTFVMPNLVQQLDRMWDPKVYDQQGVQALVTSQIPIVRRENRPVLNVLGEPIQIGPFHYWTSTQSQDPVWRFLAEKQAFIPEPSKATIIGSKRLGEGNYRAITPDEYYELVAKTGPQIKQAIADAIPDLKDSPPDEVQHAVNYISELIRKAAKEEIQP